jgi:formiminoglutamase
VDILKPYNSTDVLSLTRIRGGEKKLGEVVQSSGHDWKETLHKSPAHFVVVGIPEDVGVRGNHGRPGAHSAFRPALDSFLNQQQNVFLDGSLIMVLGEVFVDDVIKRSEGLDSHKEDDVRKLRELVSVLDTRVAEVIGAIVTAGKVPLIIGGGHNNAFGNIVGSSNALKKPINVINCDPHLDFRQLEGRHSGNGFSYAFEGGQLKKYTVFGMHEQYNNSHAVKEFLKHPARLHYESFEGIFIRENITFDNALKNCVGFVNGAPCGVEMDLDAISNVPSSARTSSGITALQARQYVHQCASGLDCVYLHIAEAAPVLSHIRADIKTGKLIAYLMTDFVKAMAAKMF